MPTKSSADQEQQRKSQCSRQRAVGGGRRFRLSLEDRLLATLFYFRLYLSGALLSYLFDLDESNLCRERNERMLPALQAVLPVPLQDHLLSAVEEAINSSHPNAPTPRSRSRKRIGTLKELLEAHPELEDIWADATEQEVLKPHPKVAKGKARKKAFYSGKSHCHTIKTQIVTSGRLIVHLFGGCPGSLHDRQLLFAS